MLFKLLTDKSPPKVTIGITCFNAEKTIERAIISALKQDYTDIEILVVDDKSTDASWEIISKFANKDARILTIRHSVNGGPAKSRNSILNNASGSVIAFFDDDDESLSDRIRTQYDELYRYEQKTGIKLIACYASGVRRYSNGYEFDMPAIGSQPDIPKGAEVAEYLLYNNRLHNVFYGAGTPTCALMARTSTFLAAGGFDSKLRRVEDVDFAIRLAMLGGHFIGCEQKLFIQYATVAPDKSPIKNLEAELLLVEKFSEYLKSKHRYNYARDWFRIRFYHFDEQHIRFFLSLVMFLFRHPIRGVSHIFRTIPARWAHEAKMKSNN